MSRDWRVPAVSAGQVGGDAYLLDVREADEWAAGHAPQAHHVPVMEVPGRLGELPTDRDLVVVCKVGARSAQVVAFLQAQGLERATNLAGGMQAWQAAGRPVVAADGRAGHIL